MAQRPQGKVKELQDGSTKTVIHLFKASRGTRKLIKCEIVPQRAWMPDKQRFDANRRC